jgi:hypothetical protein
VVALVGLAMRPRDSNDETIPSYERRLYEKWSFAELRKDELLGLNGGDIGGAGIIRRQIGEEILFHLLGTVDRLAQAVNQFAQVVDGKQGLGIKPEKTNMRNVIDKLARLKKHKQTPSLDRLHNALKALYWDTTGDWAPDPYSDDGIVERAYIYRHHVTHRGENPFRIHISIGTVKTEVFLPIDPGNDDRGYSERPIGEDLNHMFRVFGARIDDVLALL